MNKAKPLPIVLIGGGGHASVLLDILHRQGRDIVAFISPDNTIVREAFSGLHQLYQDEDILRFNPDSIRLVNGIGMLPKSVLRKKINDYFISLGYEFESVVADEATISPLATLGEGTQIFQCVTIQAGAVIGAHSIVNTGAIIEHDCKIGSYNHVAPGATLCGEVTTESDVFIGANATITQGVSVSTKSVVGAGVTLVEDLPPQTVVYPVRSITKLTNYN